MKDYIKDICVSEFSTEWERNILNLIPRRDRQKHSSFINSVMTEVKNMYIENMKDFILKSILSCKIYKREHVACEECEVSAGSEHIFEKITYDSAIFTKRRDSFAKRYFLSYPIIRHVMNTAHRILPAVICDFRRYHKLGMLTLHGFQDTILKDIKTSALVITNQFYTETCKAVQSSKMLHSLSAKRLSQLMRCLTNVFVQQILNVMMRSIDHVIDIMRDGRFCPQIEFQLICEGDRLVTEPDVEKVFSTYHNIIENIENIARDLMPLEEWLDVRATERYIKIAPPDWFLEKSHRDLQEILDALFRPVNDHVAFVSAEFSGVCKSSSRRQISSLASKRPDFDAYLAHIRRYSEYLGKANSMLSNLYYSVGKLEQNGAKESLRQICCDVIDTLTAKLVMYHRDYNRSICSDFEDLKSTALDIPRDAKSLIQLAEYMSQASKVLMKEEEERIRQSVYMLSKLLEITVFTDEHVDLNRATMNWLHDIQPVFAQNNTLCEAMKSELEEDLQRRINALNSEVDAMFPQLIILDDMDDISRIGEYTEHYKDLIKRYKCMDDEMEVINSEERLFRFPETEFPKIIELRETIVPFYALIRTVHQWRKDNSVWLNGPFEWLDAAVIEKKTVNYLNEITEVSRTMKSRIKMDATANKSYKFSGIADDPDPMQQPAPLKLCWQALNDINEFKAYLPLAVCMCNPALEARHWNEMSAICDFDLTPNAGTTLRKMIDMNLMDNIDKYKAISLGANKELYLQRELAEMVREWEPMSFEMSSDAETGVVAFKHVNDIEELLREHVIKIEEMRASHFVKPILSDVIELFAVLTRIQQILDQWARVQSRKHRLQSIFSYPGIETRLKQETSLYLEATRTLRDISERFEENPSFEEIKRSSNLLQVLNEVNEKLERASRDVRNYLDAKRSSFTRFFFLLDSEIQQILFESTNTTKLCAIVKKCFAGVERLKFNKSNYIGGVIGHYGEILRLNNDILIDSSNKCEEQWLIQLEREMRDAVCENILRYHPLITENSTCFPVDNFPSMAIFCGLQLHWTSSVEKCLAPPNTEMLNSLLATYADWTTSIIDELKEKLARRRRNLLMSLIIIMSAHKEVIKLLLERNITERTDFEWIAQLKYYCSAETVEISVFDATIEYGYEYNYYQQNIVNTPLTDRCFRTILQAYRYHLYSGVAGPTGSGKTETIKSLTRALAKPFYAVNCNNDISYNCVIQIFKGMISCGAWICFESFHGLRVELLSAIAQNLTQIKQAVSSDLKSVNFEGCDLDLNATGNICVNINTEQSGYTDLPDNLKILFRFASMTKPDVERIVEIELFAGGFLHAKDLAAKLAVSYKLLCEYLEERRHYNFGASSLKTVVATAIGMKQNFLDENEHALLLRSMIDVNISQLRDTDIPVFQSIMEDVFPESDALVFDCSALFNALENVCAKRFLAPHATFKLKAIQIVELMHIRRGLVLIGDPLSGKTEILRTLAETLSLLRDRENKIGAAVELETIVPSVVDGNALFGYFCDKSETWRDGFCTAVFRRFAESSSADRKWLVFDGDLSGTWIENLYTTLDENKMLYLTSGERLPAAESMSVVFETSSTAEISPGMISRCGIIYIDSHSIGWKPRVLSHIARHDIYSGHDKILSALFDWTIDPCLSFLKANGDVADGQELHLVTSTLNLFEILLRDACEDAADDKSKDNYFVVWAQAALILAIVWGLGGNLINDPQTRFNAFCATLLSGADAKYPKPDAIKHCDVTLPSEGLIQDNFYIFKGVGNWKYWGDLLKNEKMPEVCNFNPIYIPSVNSLKYNHVFLKHVKRRKPFLLYGDVAVGKTCLMHDLLSNKLPENCLSNFFSFASMIGATRAQTLLLSKLNKVRRTEYRPGRNQFCVNFVDDVSAAVLQRPEAQSVFELLRQFLSYGYCYDTNELNKVFIQDVTFTIAVTTGKIGGEMPSRFLRHFNTYTIAAPAADNIFKIYFNVLSANLKRNLFAADVTGSVTSIVNATIEVYKSIVKELRPVPSKLYYCFDMRDMSRVISGCGLIQKESVETKVTFIRLWAHEVLRVFGDRMSNDGDKEWLFLRIRDAVKSNFKDSFEVAFDYLPKFGSNQITKDSFGDLMFGNFMDAEKSGRCRRYEEIGSMEALRNKILAYLDEYNANFKRKIDVVVCRYMLECLIKICRVLSMPGGNLLMMSTVGSGRRTTTALAAFVQQQSFFETTAESYYDMSAWRSDLRKILRECGAARRDVAYFMSERQMKDAFLSDIGCLLSTGELPDLFSAEDRQSIIEMTRLHAQGGDRNAEMSARSVMTYFVEQCRNRLHFVLCFSPVSAAFRAYLCSHPNLAKHCTVNCYQVWPDQALLEIAVKHIKLVNVREELKARAARVCVRFHSDAKEMSLRYGEVFDRTIHVTSSAFLHMLKLYTRLTSEKQKEIVATRNRYLAGLEKLELAAEQVEQMKATLTILKPQLELSAQQTVITMKEVENENLTVERATILVKQEEEIANRKAEIAGTLKTECEADLAVAIPILEDAVLALNTLKPTDITLVKAMKNPPDTIKLVMAAVCVMLSVPPDRTIDPATGKKFTDYWGPSKRILGDMNFLQNLKDYDKDDIAPAIMQVIKKTYMTDNSFMPHIVAKASSAAEGLCKWVRAMVSYDEVAKVVAPKKKKLAEAQMECDEAEAFLNEKQQTLAALNAKLAALNDSLRQTLQKKLNLEMEVATCTAKLVKAEKLIASLGGEKSRWMQYAHNLQMNYDSLAGDMLLSCGIMAYMASYSTSFRDETLTKWKEFMEASEIPYTKTYDFINVLGVEIEINHWQLCGLSKNRFAVENAIILKNSEQWCLFVDSQSQINQWIKKIEKKNNLTVVKLTDPDYMSIIERNIENGDPILLENVGETLEIALEPILLKSIYRDDETWYIDIATKSIKYSQNFRLYITTRLSDPNYTADIFSKLTIIDFSMPDGTLQDKLLDIVVSKERPELQEKFEALRIQDAINKKVLQQQEDNILSTLSSTTTNILEDEGAIQTLDSSKNLTVDIVRKQEAARAMIGDINRFRDAYLQFADHCARLFCTLNTLSNLNHMYRFSFSWFIQLYVTSIETSNRSVVLEKRLQFLKSSFTRNLHSSVCRSLFERHKLLYSFLLCVRIMIDTRETTQEEVEHFISTNAGDSDVVLESAPEWLPTIKWKEICKLSSALADFRELADDFRINGAVWKKYCNAEPFASRPIPKPWADRLTRFQQLMLIKIVRRDKIIVEIMRLIEDTMEDVFNSYPRLQIAESYAESSCLTPIIFILPSYASPLSLVSAYASARGYTSKFISLSMGDGQANNAEVLVERARKEGGWILLLNCHHAASWIPRLEGIYENLNLSDTSLDFRLWLSSCSVPDFPISILQNSVKIAYDYPLRLKQGLLRAYRSEPIRSKEFFEGCPGRDKEFSKLLYGLCFFHGIVRQRRHFGPQGWNMPYDFDHMDFEMSIRQLQNLINAENLSFDTLLYLVGECNYGGKIIDNIDRKCLRYLLRCFCNARVIDSGNYSFSDCAEHAVPQRCEYRDIIIHINDMQLDASPEAFATDENALVRKDTAVAEEFLKSISRLDQIGSPSDDVAQDKILQAIDKITDKLPALFNINEIQEKHPLTSRDPLNAILIYEAELINRILIIITESLNNLKSALNGEIVLTDSLEDFAKEIYKNKIPRVWKTIDVGIVTEYLPNYISLFLKRVNYVQSWHDSGLPRIVRFDALSCCKRFLLAALLMFSRCRNVPVEQITLNLKVKKCDSTSSEESVDTYYIHGLYLSGARWDTQRHVLIESLTNVFWHDMPPICLTFSTEEKAVDNIYECPVYISSMRYHEVHTDTNRNKRNFITSVSLETDKSHEHWIKRGTALFCQVDK
ncbi:dynein axonemal heavy chain 7-like [Linepithema humile]|uniref:dynein axonemal heavy chain 7-like n=1 Tax=Linepithema humile TaxID=83485 RepID=UPI00351EB13D